MCRAMRQTTNQTTGQTINQTANRTINQTANRTINQTANRTINQTISKTTQRATHRSMHHVGIYCRVSVEEREKEGDLSNSIRSQIQMAEDYIAAHPELETGRVYADDGVSGSHFDRREFRRMLADIELGILDTVIVKDVSRLGRNHIDTGYYLGRYFPERQVRVISLLDHYDSQEGIGGELLGIRTLLDEMYLRDTSGKIKAAIRAKRLQGEYTSGEPPFGYRKSRTHPGYLEMEKYAAGIVRRIFHLYLEGKGYAAIARRLNEEQVLPPARYKKETQKTGYGWKTGKGLWTSAAVGVILKNPVYTGAVVVRKYEDMPGRRSGRRLLPPEKRELAENAHEAIVTKGEFAQAQLLRKSRRITYFEKKGEVHRYAGLLFCGQCRTAMRKSYRASHRDYDGYVCGFHQEMGRQYCELNRISFELLDRLTAFALNCQLQGRGEELRLTEREILRSDDKAVSERRRLEGRLERVRDFQKLAYEQFLDGKLSREAYLGQRERYEEERRRCRETIDGLMEAEEAGKRLLEERKCRLAAFREGRVTPELLTKPVLSELIAGIYVYPKQRVEIFFLFESGEAKMKAGRRKPENESRETKGKNGSRKKKA